MSEKQHATGAQERTDSIGGTKNLALTEATAHFRRAIISLLGTLHAGQIAALLGNRAHRTTIYNWLIGRREPPQWALDTVRQLLRERIDRDLAITLQPVKRGPDRAEHARRLTPIRLAKEKARREAGQV